MAMSQVNREQAAELLNSAIDTLQQLHDHLGPPQPDDNPDNPSIVQKHQGSGYVLNQPENVGDVAGFLSPSWPTSY